MLQVQALVNAPFLLENERITAEFPEDAIARAREMLTKLPGGVGAYQDSRGSPAIRQEIADFLQHRDGYPSNAEVAFTSILAAAVAGMRSALNWSILASSGEQLAPSPSTHPPTKSVLRDSLAWGGGGGDKSLWLQCFCQQTPA